MKLLNIFTSRKRANEHKKNTHNCITNTFFSFTLNLKTKLVVTLWNSCDVKIKLWSTIMCMTRVRVLWWTKSYLGIPAERFLELTWYSLGVVWCKTYRWILHGGIPYTFIIQMPPKRAMVACLSSRQTLWIGHWFFPFLLHHKINYVMTVHVHVDSTVERFALCGCRQRKIWTDCRNYFMVTKHTNNYYVTILNICAKGFQDWWGQGWLESKV